jgi:hypothetical protein
MTSWVHSFRNYDPLFTSLPTDSDSWRLQNLQSRRRLCYRRGIRAQPIAMTEEKGLGDCMISSLLTHGRLWGRAHNPYGFCKISENQKASSAT